MFCHLQKISPCMRRVSAKCQDSKKFFGKTCKLSKSNTNENRKNNFNRRKEKEYRITIGLKQLILLTLL